MILECFVGLGWFRFSQCNNYQNEIWNLEKIYICLQEQGRYPPRFFIYFQMVSYILGLFWFHFCNKWNIHFLLENRSLNVKKCLIFCWLCLNYCFSPIWVNLIIWFHLFLKVKPLLYIGETPLFNIYLTLQNTLIHFWDYLKHKIFPFLKKISGK